MPKRAYRYRFYPTAEQAHLLACTFGCVRYIYNWALQERKTAYNERGERLSTKDLSARMTALKQQEHLSWLKDVSSVPLQQSLRHLDTAYTNFFEGRAEYPVCLVASLARRSQAVQCHRFQGYGRSLFCLHSGGRRD
jgi:putative transposase